MFSKKEKRGLNALSMIIILSCMHFFEKKSPLIPRLEGRKLKVHFPSQTSYIFIIYINICSSWGSYTVLSQKDACIRKKCRGLLGRKEEGEKSSHWAFWKFIICNTLFFSSSPPWEKYSFLCGGTGLYFQNLNLKHNNMYNNFIWEYIT